jgi:serine/threonine-protein kinase
MLALVQRLAGDFASASATAQEAQQALETLCSKDPNSPIWPWLLSRAYAALGEKNAALKEAQRAVTLLPTSKDAVDSPSFEENLALIEAMFGDKDRAIGRLQHLLQIPYNGTGQPITPALLRLDPAWDPLRDDPRFQKLCEEKPH